MESYAVTALHGVSLEIAAGEFVAVMGPSGSGKSTFMNLLGCLDTPTSGEYLLAGEKVSELSGDALAAMRNRRIGFVFQNFNLLAAHLRGRERRAAAALQPTVPAAERRRSALARLAEVGLAERAAPPSRAALGRPAAARRDRARARQRPGADPRRRADRRARHAHELRADGAAAAAEPRRHDGRAGDARARRRGVRLAHHRASATATWWTTGASRSRPTRGQMLRELERGARHEPGSPASASRCARCA